MGFALYLVLSLPVFGRAGDTPLADRCADEFDAGLRHVIARFRGVLAARAADGTVTDG